MLWKGFQRPKRLEFERETLTDRFGRFYAQPFERGFGTTIGNALRRVLLSSIEGAAVTAVKIDGVLHEFSPIPGVVEDATDIILNLKQIPLKMHVDTTKTLYLRVDKAGEVKARDIETDADVEILEPDAHIATVAEGGKLHMEMRVKRGRGYVSADKNFDEDLGIGWIPIDSVHSPIKKVNYLVEAARIGQATDYDKLTVDVWTNGSVTPRDAVSLSAKLIRDHLNIFINLEDAGDLQQEVVGDSRAPAAQREPRQERRGARALGPLVQLPEEREHPNDSRARAEDRRRDAQDEELRPQVSERDQRDSVRDGPEPRHAARPADGTVARVTNAAGFGARDSGLARFVESTNPESRAPSPDSRAVTRIKQCVTESVTASWGGSPSTASPCCATRQRRSSSTSTSRRRCRRRRSCVRSSSGSSRSPSGVWRPATAATRGRCTRAGSSCATSRIATSSASCSTRIAPRFEARPGGYTRILRLGYRRGDSAEVAQIELVGSEYNPNAERRRARSPT